MKRLTSVILLSIFCVTLYAQIGYQVALLNHANGEPRRNEVVSVKVDIIDSADHIIYSQTQSATTNDFGLVSLNIGNETTFRDVDWSKLPLFISATVDGVMVGKSQILNVPVAEYALKAKELDGSITASNIIGTWRNNYYDSDSDYWEITFDDKDKFRYVIHYEREGSDKVTEGTYHVLSNGLIFTDISSGYSNYVKKTILCDAVGKIDNNHIITISDDGRFGKMVIYTRQ